MSSTYLKVLRVASYGSQKEASKSLGISRPYYSMIESGRLTPTDEIKSKIETAFKLPISKLLQTADKLKVL